MYFLRLSTRAFSSSARRLTGDSADQFGTLSKTGYQQLKALAIEQTVPDDPDGYDQIETTIRPRKNGYYYDSKISLYARQGKVGLKTALELFRQMKVEDRLTPRQGNFSALIYGCALAGYTKKAFDLYEEYLKYMRPGKQPSAAMVACLFNCCAECPFPEYGLQRLEWLKIHLANKYSYIYNRIHYHTQIKAYGKLGKCDKAFGVIQEMIQANIPPNTVTFNMLLVACASDEEAGLAKAIRIFRRIKYYKLEPSIETYRLLLRCVRDCNLGSIETIQHVLGELPQLTQGRDEGVIARYRQRGGKKSKIKSIPVNPIISEWIALDEPPSKTNRVSYQDGSSLPATASLNTQLMVIDSGRDLETSAPAPNLLKDSASDLIVRVESLNLGALQTMYNRLKLVGDVKGILDMMNSDGIQPDAKLFGLLLTCLPRKWSKDREILTYMQDYPIVFDERIYDMMIERNCSRISDPHRMDIALKILEIMQQRGVQPSISTYEALALGCATLKDAEKLINDLGETRLTYTLVKNLFINACHSNDMYYAVKLMQRCQRLKLRPDKKLVEKLELKRLEIRALILDYENGRLEHKPEFLTENFIKGFDIYSSVMKQYLKETPLQEEEHPWSQFKVENHYGRKGFNEFAAEMNKMHKDYRAKQIS